MRIDYATPYEYWHKVANNSTGRLFLPTSGAHAIGDRLRLELGVRGVPEAAQLTGVVVGRRSAVGRMPAGVFVRLGPSELAKARAYLHIDAQVPQLERLRAAQRFRCSFPLRFLRPQLERSSRVMNLSQGGLLAIHTPGLMEGEQVEVAVDTPSGLVQLEAEVEWLIGSGVGLRFVRLSTEATEALGGVLHQLGRAEEAWKTLKAEPVVVVADRHPDSCSRLSVLLGELGARTLTVQDGRELVSLCRAVAPDAVFLDVLLEGLDGPQACRQMRSEQEVGDVPMVLTGQLPEAELERLAMDEGANDFLVKPLSAADLGALWHRLFGAAAVDNSLRN